MKRIFGRTLAFAMTLVFALSAFAQSPAPSREETLKQVESASAEIKDLHQKILGAKLQRGAAVVIGVTAGTVSVLSLGFGTLATFFVSRSMTSPARQGVQFGGMLFLAGGTAAAAGAYGAYRWYEVKADEIPALEKAVADAEAKLDGAKRALQIVAE